MQPPNSDGLSHRLGLPEHTQSHWRTLISRENHDDDPFVWTIRDILTLLLIFFIVLYTHANSHAKPVQPTPQREVAAATVSDPAYQQLRQEVERFMQQRAGQGFSVRWDQTRPVFVLGERITFPEGRADLLESSRPALKRIADFISTHPGYRIIISGHTDNIPINTDAYPSNWELSAARAARLARVLTENGIDPQLVTIQGYAQYSPLFENSIPENREANRRVEIKLTREKG